MNRVLILGGSGLLGCTMSRHLRDRGFDVTVQSRSKGHDVCFDPSDVQQCMDAITSLEPHVVVNLVASTSVDQCESDWSYAYAGNIKPAIALVSAIEYLRSSCRVIHISTDHVYSNKGFSSEAQALPVNEYALTKLAAEAPVLNAGGVVLRTNMFGRSECPSRSSFTDWIYNSVKNGERIALFCNVRISALHLMTLSEMVGTVIERFIPGLFNLGTDGGASKAEIGMRLADELCLDADLISISELTPDSGRVRRPLDMQMNSVKFASTFGIDLPGIWNEVDRAIGDYDGTR